MKICSTCKEEKPLDKFNWKNKEAGTRVARCKDCRSKIASESWATGKLKQANYEAKARRVRAAQDYIWEYLLGSKCWDCGERNPLVLEFDHLEDKSHDVSNMVSQNYGLAAIRAEIAKCDVVCANCHRIRTLTRAGHWRVQRLTTES